MMVVSKTIWQCLLWCNIVRTQAFIDWEACCKNCMEIYGNLPTSKTPYKLNFINEFVTEKYQVDLQENVIYEFKETKISYLNQKPTNCLKITFAMPGLIVSPTFKCFQFLYGGRAALKMIKYTWSCATLVYYHCWIYWYQSQWKNSVNHLYIW